jgi:cytochrome P450
VFHHHRRGTSATLANWAIERLVRTPNALASATAEASGGDEQMPFLDAVLRETLHPPIVLVSRLTRQPLTLREHHFPADALIVPVIRSVHYMRPSTRAIIVSAGTVPAAAQPIHGLG